MEEIIATFKDLIALFYKQKSCKVIPVLDDLGFVRGYYQKKNITAHIADISFLSEKLKDAQNKVLSLASSENEGAFLEELGTLDNFPVLKPDGTYQITDFNSFLANHIPLKYNLEIEDTEENHTGEVLQDFLGIKHSQETDGAEKEGESMRTAKDMFELTSEKIKPFFEEFDFNDTFDLVAYLEGVEKRVIDKYLKYYDYNISHTAEALKIPRQTLQYKIKKYNL